MEFQELLEAFVALGLGWKGLVMVGVVLFGVLFAKKAGVVATGNHARLASVVLSAVMAGLTENPQSEGALLAVLSVVLAGLANDLFEKLGEKLNAPWLVQLLGVNSKE